ncbi:MAG: porin family protein [Candidatus Cyclobacteriaceae bacterium M3_2C_046]
MYTSNLWHQLHLHRHKVTLLFFLAILSFFQPVQAQVKEGTTINLPDYDQKWLHYGFTIGLHSSYYRVTYNDQFVNALDSLHSVVPPGSFGFSLGFIVNFRLAQYLDFRVLPKVSFYENKLEYNFTDNSSFTELVETTFVEFPLLLKFKSQRRGNSRMYLIGGVTPGIEATGKKDDRDDNEKLLTRGANLSFDFGFGLDLYYPLFKFSPEIRYSRGFVNILKSEVNPFSEGLDRITTNTISLYIQFE